MSDAPAGWYPDPSAPQSLRYWGGAAWTEHVAPGPGGASTYPAVVPTTPDGVPLAGWWMRVLAYVVDAVLVGVLGMLAGLSQQLETQRRMNALSAELQSSAQPDFSAFWHGYADVLRDQMLSQLPIVLLGVGYFAVMLRWKGATVGKLVVGLRVRLRDAPGRLPWSAIAVRVLLVNVIGVLPMVALAFSWWWVAAVAALVITIFVPLNLLWPLWDSKRQALHDKAARTNVVKVR